ncbi:phosphoglycerate mutase-like protein AT74H [Magnolia sinica]|uniref:phosphoglycerate mutase-like protein AT74H n=1 Tax=Magnolia sinica TaxID=86752 RepID=UPI00265A2645|nr:phosphoglycerate mutase-like protein AT74H [Magnolia sinica]
MASASFLFSTLSIPISREKTNPTISSRIRCCEDTLGNPNLKLIDASNGKGMDRFPEKLSVARAGSCPRPRRIILVRHGQSEGNVDESVYTMVPDPKIKLTQKGWDEAEGCGKMIRDMIESDGVDDWKVYFYVSPYARTLETLRGLGRAFDRDRIAGVREEPRLREQDFGNFQDREKMRIEKVLRNRYGRFFYRFPDGESAADVYDRITGFRETLRADIDIGRFQPPGKRTENMNLVIVSHGLTLRVFLMRWYKWTVEQFEGLNNFDNGGMLVMELGDGGRYSLLVHHTEEELRRFGLTDEMLTDQKWQKTARPGELNYECNVSGPSFFKHLS